MSGWLMEKWRWFTVADPAQRARRWSHALGSVAIAPMAWALFAVLRAADLVRPIRVGALNGKGRLSSMISYIEPYLRRQRMAGGRQPLVIVINPGRDPNAQLSRMYARAVWLLDDRSPWLRDLFLAMHRMAGARSRLHADLHEGATIEYAVQWQSGDPVLQFTPEERAAGTQLLQALGVPEGAPYACFGIREPGYYRQFLEPEAVARHPNREAREDTYVRNPPMAHYLPMAAECAAEGWYMIRMGEAVDAPLPAGLHPRIIDYASSSRTPFGDVYLLATCAFAVAGAAGLWWIASAFNRPVVLTDSYCLWARGLRASDLFIPKTLWLETEQRCLTFREALEAGMRYTYQSNCAQDGIAVLHNTAEEIADVVREMRQRLKGTWQAMEEDDALQQRFTALYRPEYRMGYGLPGRLGAAFLRQRADLLPRQGVLV